MKKLNKILIIDDDQSTCFLETYLLEDMNVSDEIVCVYSGEEALEYLQECRKRKIYPDLIFLNIRMPGMDGFELLEELKAFDNSEISQLYIVILSSSSGLRDIQRARSFKNLKGYINKPLTETIVRNILQEICLSPLKE